MLVRRSHGQYAQARSTEMDRAGSECYCPTLIAILRPSLIYWRLLKSSSGWDGRGTATFASTPRFAAGIADQYPSLAKELAALEPDVMLSESTPAAAALKQQTRSIPIVFVGVSDPVGSGFVTSLARPGGDLTGMMQYESSIMGKWLAMLKEAHHASPASLSSPIQNSEGTNTSGDLPKDLCVGRREVSSVRPNVGC